MRRWLTALAVLTVATSTPALSGCTLLGLGVGSSITRWEEVRPVDVPRYKKPGEALKVQLHMKPGPEDATAQLEGIPGVFGALRPEDMIVVWEGHDVRRVPLERVDTVEVAAGTHWLSGMVVGLVFDATLTIALIYAASQSVGAGPSGISFH